MSKQCDSTFTNASDYHYMQGYQDGIKQGRTDVIDEVVKELERLHKECDGRTYAYQRAIEIVKEKRIS